MKEWRGRKNSSFFPEELNEKTPPLQWLILTVAVAWFFSGNVFLRGFHVERKPAAFFLALSIFNVYLTGQQCTMHAMCVSHKCEQFRTVTFFFLPIRYVAPPKQTTVKKRGEREMRKHKNVSSFCMHECFEFSPSRAS